MLPSTQVQPGLQQSWIELIEKIEDEYVRVEDCSNQISLGEVNEGVSGGSRVLGFVQVLGIGKCCCCRSFLAAVGEVG